MNHDKQPDAEQQTEHGSDTAQGPTTFRVGQYSARLTRRENAMGLGVKIELSRHEPDGVTCNVATFERHHVVDACAALQLALVADAVASTQDWLLANLRWSPPGSLGRAIDRVIDYLWSEEHRDYFEREPDDRAGHIFEELMLLQRFAIKR